MKRCSVLDRQQGANDGGRVAVAPHRLHNVGDWSIAP